MGHKRYRLHVVDLDPSSVTSGGWLEDTSLVEKYKISDEAYKKRDGEYPSNYVYLPSGCFINVLLPAFGNNSLSAF